MDRLIVPVNFDNDKDLYDYANSKGNRAEFIRYCIRKEMMQEKSRGSGEKELENTLERVFKKCLEEYRPALTKQDENKQSTDIAIAASFFDED